MGEVCVNSKLVEKIEFVDASDNNRVIGTFNFNGSQHCDNGYMFKITYMQGTIKE